MAVYTLPNHMWQVLFSECQLKDEAGCLPKASFCEQNIIQGRESLINEDILLGFVSSKEVLLCAMVHKTHKSHFIY